MSHAVSVVSFRRASYARLDEKREAEEDLGQRALAVIRSPVKKNI
jgi:hypothetical protein